MCDKGHLNVPVHIRPKILRKIFSEKRGYVCFDI